MVMDKKLLTEIGQHIANAEDERTLIAITYAIALG